MTFLLIFGLVLIVAIVLSVIVTLINDRVRFGNWLWQDVDLRCRFGWHKWVTWKVFDSNEYLVPSSTEYRCNRCPAKRTEFYDC